MMRAVRLLLILSFALTGYALASARGQTMIGERVVLCSGQAVVLTYGADGRPQESAHFCPDMAINLLAAVAVVAAYEPPVVRVVQVSTSQVRKQAREAPVIVAKARDPPLVAVS